MKPDNYWQLDAGQSGAPVFVIEPSYNPQQGWSNAQQLTSILGLPLMNNHYVVFDRGTGPEGLGEIKFAAQNPAGFPG